MAYSRGSGGHEDERSKVSSALVAKSASSVDESTNTVGLDTRADEGRAPGGSGGGSLSGLEELLLGVCGLGAVVGLTEERSHHGEGSDMAEDGAEGDGRGLDGRKVY